MRFVLMVMAALACCLSLQAQTVDVRFEQQTIFTADTEGYAGFRIPGLIDLGDGVLLAFAEGRVKNLSDYGDIDVVYRRSTDDGKTWGPFTVLEDQGGSRIGNPTPLYDPRTSQLHVLFSRAGSGKKINQFFIRTSTDGGQSFAPAREITTAFDGFNAILDKPWIRGNPIGHGIAHSSGRLIVPVHVATSDDHNDFHDGVIVSDDGGLTWKAGGVVVVPEKSEGESEPSVAERADGSLIMAVRTRPDCFRRAFAISTDAGNTWSPAHFADDIVAPSEVYASVAAIPDNQGHPTNNLVFSAPYSDSGNFKQRRRNQSIWFSPNGGQDWPIRRQVLTGGSSYSILAATGSSSISLLYETRDNGADVSGDIVFARFNQAWLSQSPPEPAASQ